MELLLLFIPLLLLTSSLIVGLSSNNLGKISAGILSSTLVFVALIFSSIILFNF